jgi:hypothetical protein
MAGCALGRSCELHTWVLSEGLSSGRPCVSEWASLAGGASSAAGWSRRSQTKFKLTRGPRQWPHGTSTVLVPWQPAPGTVHDGIQPQLPLLVAAWPESTMPR